MMGVAQPASMQSAVGTACGLTFSVETWLPSALCRGKRRAPLSAAQEVGRCLQRIVVSVEQQEAQEAREVVQVRRGEALELGWAVVLC